jgi:hypothetical protein
LTGELQTFAVLARLTCDAVVPAGSIAGSRYVAPIMVSLDGDRPTPDG